MSNHTNHKRNEDKRTETGPRFENPNPGAGCNSTHVARSRRKWKTRSRRRERRALAWDEMTEEQRIDKMARDTEAAEMLIENR